MKENELGLTKASCEFCDQDVNAIDLELMLVPLSKIKMWACDECRKANKEIEENEN